MDKSMIFLILINLLLSPNCKNSDTVVFTLEITNPKIIKEHVIKLDKFYQFQKMEIILNNLEDTCMIGVMKIPPGKIGLLYNIELMADKFPVYKYIPYKNKNGKITIKHYFYNL
jgi:hypothetical protein